MKSFAWLAASFGVHFVVALFYLCAATGVLKSLAYQQTKAALISLAAVAILGVAKVLRWKGKHNGAFLAGGLLAGLAYSFLWLGFDWAMTHPTGPSVSYLSYVADVVRQRNGAIAALAPAVLIAAASIAGHGIARLLGAANREKPATASRT